VNDTDEPWLGSAELARYDFDGAALASARVEVSCAPRGVQRIAVPADVAAARFPDRCVNDRTSGIRRKLLRTVPGGVHGVMRLA
jgi:hypothetical protein